MSDQDPTMVSEAINALREEVEQLRDLFQRRLLEDKSKKSLIEAVQEQSRATTDVLRYRQLESLAKEALLAVDRLRAEPPTLELNDSVAEELLEVFFRRDLIEVDDSGDFDARVHQIIGTVNASEQFPVDSIVSVARTGYLLGDRLLRPAQVTVAVQADG
ncbi:nucleotide exchange factor GrpE [Glutamicibacter arilaitensis]|uniref:nucleotide exchange factor GrpE n=1 Tax=Glutamicibacter arilaitensis TaxID=256701 RepID=UPI00384E6116